MGSAQVTTGYLGDLAAAGAIQLNVRDRYSAIAFTGGRLIIPPSKAATCGTVADAKIPAATIIRTAILITFFMGVSPTTILGFPKGSLDAVRNYKARVKSFFKLDLRRLRLPSFSAQESPT